MDTAEILKLCRCGGCHQPVAKSRNLNLVGLRRKATWEYPTSCNVLTGDVPCAVALACDACIRANAVMKEAIELRGGKPVYHPVETLEPMGLAPTHRILSYRSYEAIECLVCGAVSQHPDDVLNEYCARCQKFHPIDR